MTQIEGIQVSPLNPQPFEGLSKRFYVLAQNNNYQGNGDSKILFNSVYYIFTMYLP